MNAADIIGLFCRLEGLPNAICEGMYLGKPIIMSKVSDYQNFISKKNGVLCDWDSVESIANVFRTVITLTDNEIMEMGGNLKTLQKNYLIARMYSENGR